MSDINYRELMDIAEETMKNAYVPYSGFYVGAALLAKDGRIFTGVNVENASYPAGICAERTAIFKAVSEGCREFEAIAIAGGTDAHDQGDAYPCGICRQVMAEFCDLDTFEIIIKDKKTKALKSYRLKDILPLAFVAENLAGTK